MLDRFGHWYVVASICLMLALPIYALIHLNSLRAMNSEAAARHFQATTETVRAVVDTSSRAPTPNFWRNTLAPILDQPSTLVALVISETAGTIEYLWANDGDLPSISRHRGASLRHNRLYELVFSDTITTRAGPFVVENLYRVIDRSTIFVLIRNGLGVMVVFVLLTFMLLLIQMRRSPAIDRQSVALSPPARSTAPGTSSQSSRARPDAAGLWPIRSATLKLIGRYIRRAYIRRQELSLALVSYESSGAHSDTCSKHCEQLAQRTGFAAHRLAWSGNEWLIAMPNVALQQSWPLIRDALAHISQESAHKGCAPTVGISSRENRRLRPDRLIRECEAALQRAHDTAAPLALFMLPSSRA